MAEKKEREKFRQQGDVLFHEVEVDLEKAKRLTPDAHGRYVLVEGEATGHAHAIAATPEIELYEKEGKLFVKVLGEKPATVTHEEHGAMQLLPKKTYRVDQVREMDPFTEREHVVWD